MEDKPGHNLGVHLEDDGKTRSLLTVGMNTTSNVV